MNVAAHYRSITRELEALRDRVRNFSVRAPHWPTDGEWKESVLRAVLRQHLPAHVEPLRGFVVAPGAGSGQIDILLYDNRKPVLFRNGDLVFVTPDAVLGIVEVKSRIANRNLLRAALASVADDAQMILANRSDNGGIFVGLLSYTSEVPITDAILDDLQSVARGESRRNVNHVCLGRSHFARYWGKNPRDRRPGYDKWHAYQLDDLAAGYFVSNLVASVAGESVSSNYNLWFPEQTKELRRLGARAFNAATRTNRPTINKK